MAILLDKRADLAGPGIGDYKELETVLPSDYRSLLTPRETEQAIFQVKRYIEDNLCKELNLMMVEVPLIVDVESGVNDMLDRDGSRTPIQFHISNDRELHPIDAQVVQAATKWKRGALKQFDCRAGEGICTDMRAEGRGGRDLESDGRSGEVCPIPVPAIEGSAVSGSARNADVSACRGNP